MSLLRLAWLGVRRRPLSSLLTALYIGLGTALALLVVAGRDSTERSFTETARGYDLLLAPQNGSGLQAVLTTLFFVDQPAGTLPWAAFERARKDPRTKVAVPYVMGDTFRGHRVVGTSVEHFQVLTDAQGRSLGDGVTGRLFAPTAFEAVVGSLVSRGAGLALGDEIQVSHGIVAAAHEHSERWKVVGILRPTGTPQDRAIFIPVDTFYEIEGHEEPAERPGPTEHPREAEHPDEPPPHDPEEHAERRLSAVGVRLTTPFLRLEVYGQLRKDGQGVQPAMPQDEVQKLLENVVGPVHQAFRWMALLVLLVGGLGILVGLMNTLQGRRREIAILRALGARPGHVFLVLLLESVLLCLLGGLLGLALGHSAVAVLAPHALADYGVRLRADPGTLDLALLGALAGLGVLVGLLPAWRGLRTPVASNLGLSET